jgi:hypothetical protein
MRFTASIALVAAAVVPAALAQSVNIDSVTLTQVRAVGRPMPANYIDIPGSAPNLASPSKAPLAHTMLQVSR